jgi:FHS family L-fucose permease-like MFS transporter
MRSQPFFCFTLRHEFSHAISQLKSRIARLGACQTTPRLNWYAKDCPHAHAHKEKAAGPCIRRTYLPSVTSSRYARCIFFRVTINFYLQSNEATSQLSSAKFTLIQSRKLSLSQNTSAGKALLQSAEKLAPSIARSLPTAKRIAIGVLAPILYQGAPDCRELRKSNPMSPRSETSAAVAIPKTNQRAVAIVTTLFFMWGFITVLNDVLVPHLKSIFDLGYAEVMLVQFAFFSAYFVFSMPAGALVERLGYKQTMVIGLCTMAVGAFLFIGAATAPSFPLFLTALIVVAAGITALQVSANPYVAILGAEDTASSRLNLAQAFNSLGTTIGPYFGSLVILSGAPKAMSEIRKLTPLALHDYRLHEAASVKWPYLGIGFALLALAFFLFLKRLPDIAPARLEVSSELVGLSIWSCSNLLLAAGAIFVYVGAEVSIGSFLVNYLSQPNIGALTVNVAARYVSLYWGGAMIGRFMGSALLQKMRTETLLAICATVACLLVLTSILTAGQFAMWSIVAVGLFNSIMFPSIFALGVQGLGQLTGKGSGLLVAAIVGGAIVPELQGIFADRIGIHHAFILPAICYMYILYFAVARARAHEEGVLVRNELRQSARG